MKRLLKILGYTLLVILLLVVVAVWMLSRERYQNLLVKRVAKYLSEKMHTRVEVAHVKFGFFNQFDIQGVYIEDQQKDTLAYIGTIRLKTSELFSNYWNNQAPVLKDALIDDVLVQMKRSFKSDRWNYEFISEAFASSNQDTTSVKTETAVKKSSSEPDFDLKHITLSRVRFHMDDAWRGEDMHFDVGSLDLNIEQLNLAEKKLGLNGIAIDRADILVKEYEGGKPEDITPDDTTTWGTPFNPDLFSIAVKKLKVSNSAFAYNVNGAISQPGEFDEKNLKITGIQITLSDTRVLADTIFSRIEQLTAKERSGLSVESLTANAKVSQVQSRLDNLKLLTANSSVGDHFEMNYRNFHDFKSYIEKVYMKAHLQRSNVSSRDVAYFANVLNQYPITVDVSGDYEGTVEHIKGKDIYLATRNTMFKGSGQVDGLPDIDQTIFNVDVASLQTSGEDLNALIPQTRVDAVNWKALKQITYSGNYSGKVENFKTKGILTSTLGNADLDLNMNFKPTVPTYNGDLALRAFDIGTLIMQSSMGKMSMQGKIDGQGFDLNTLKANVKADVSLVELNGNVYHSLAINGLVANKKFDGIFVSVDPDLAMNFDGKLDLSGEAPVYNFNTRLIRFDMQKLGLTQTPLIVSGYATLNFNGNHIDNFIGTALLKNIVIDDGIHQVKMDTLLLESTITNAGKHLQLNSSIADASLKGNFNISELPSAFQLYLCHYLPEYIPRPKHFKDEEFVFEVTIKEADSVLHVFLPEYRGITGTKIIGDLNTYKQKFTLDVNVPTLGYQDILFNDIAIVGAGDFNSLDVNANSGSMYYKEDLMIPSFQINTSMARDTASLSINTQSINEILGSATLSFKATAFDNNLYVSVLPSNISIKEDQWQIYSNHNMVFGKHIIVRDLILESGAQRISVNTRNALRDDLIVDMEQIDLENLSNYASLSTIYRGRLNGHVEVEDFQKDQKINATVQSVSDLMIDQDTIGHIYAKVNYDVADKILRIDPQTKINRGGDEAKISGIINAEDSTINIKTQLKDMSISFVNQFLYDYVRNIKGRATGHVNVEGRLQDPKVSGNITLNDASLKVLFLGTGYNIAQAKFRFNNRTIDMDNIVIKDERPGNHTGLLSGQIRHKNFSDFYLDFSMQTNDLLCLNTREWDNELFYGYVPASADLRLKGYLDDITMDIDARPLKGSQFYLPVGSSGDASVYEYIRFAEIGRSQTEVRQRKKKNYLKLNMNIDATPDAQVFIVLDKNTGEEIIARGNGTIQMNVDLGNDINMYGTYNITEGKYLFNFRGVLSKEFVIDETSKITWSGDPLDATLDVKAIYKLPKSLPLYPLVSDQASSLDDLDRAEAKKPYATYVPLTLSKSLAQPEIKFDIIQPDNKAVGTAGYTKLEQIKNDEKELVSQAGVLLLLGEFKASDGISQGSYSRGSISTVSDLVSSAVSGEVTNQFQKLTGLKNISLNVNYQNYSPDEASALANRNQFSVNISANLLKDRVIVDFGNSVDVGRDAATGKTTSNYNIGGDFKAQVLLTEDGRVRLNAFRINTIDAEGENVTRGGLGISYKKVFNSFTELFTSHKKKKPARITESSPKTES
ncbi:MAG: translocation/assembly module TamB domain-containing protein [Chitinophagaceae bacterium]|nr:translocation/assembly module TamB domain-containing protein [Chitinophagaceae bacterium]